MGVDRATAGRVIVFPWGAVVAAGVAVLLSLVIPWRATDLAITDQLQLALGWTVESWEPSSGRGLSGGIPGAALAGGVALALALAGARLRASRLCVIVGGLAILLLGAAAGAASRDLSLPVTEWAFGLLLAPIAGALDRGRELDRALDALAGPLLRATAAASGRTRGEDAIPRMVGPGLAELLDANELLLLESPPGARAAVPTHGFRLRAADLRPDSPLAVDRFPFVDAAGIRRMTTAESLLDGKPGVALLPLTSSGSVEGYLLVVPRDDVHPSIFRCPGVAAAVGEGLADMLRARRLGAGVGSRWLSDAGGRIRRLLEAARALDEDTAGTACLASAASTGWLVLSPAGVTRLKNPRFDILFGRIVQGGSGDVANVLSIARQIGESQAATLERLLGSRHPIRLLFENLMISITAMRSHDDAPARGLLVETESLEALARPAIVPLAATAGTQAQASWNALDEPLAPVATPRLPPSTSVSP